MSPDSFCLESSTTTDRGWENLFHFKLYKPAPAMREIPPMKLGVVFWVLSPESERRGRQRQREH